MKDWQLEVMADQAATEAWNRQNAPDPAEASLKKAAERMCEALRFMNLCTDRMNEAAAILKETPMEDVVISFVDQLDDIGSFIRGIKQKYERGERE